METSMTQAFNGFIQSV